MEIIYAEVLIANCFAFGIRAIMARQLKELKNRLDIILPDNYYIDITRDVVYSITESRPDMFNEPNESKRPNFNGIVRGWRDSPEQFIALIKDEMKSWGLSKEEQTEIADAVKNHTDLSFLSRVFTPQYVDEIFNWRIPKECRVEFVRICREFAEQELAKAQAS